MISNILENNYMNDLHFLVSTIIWIILVCVVYTHTNWKNILNCYGMFLDRQYWTNYNIIECISWAAKAIIIIPGLLFGIQIWWLYFLTLFTSLSLIWASNKKLLPTLVAFNTIWSWISCVVLVKHFL